MTSTHDSKLMEGQQHGHADGTACTSTGMMDTGNRNMQSMLASDNMLVHARPQSGYAISKMLLNPDCARTGGPKSSVRRCRRHADCGSPIAGVIPHGRFLATRPSLRSMRCLSTGRALCPDNLLLRRITTSMSTCCCRPSCGQQEQRRTRTVTGAGEKSARHGTRCREALMARCVRVYSIVMVLRFVVGSRNRFGARVGG